MASTITVACIQLNSSQSVSENLEKVLRFSRQAIEQQGAQWIVLPENAFCHPYDKSRQAELDKVMPTLQAFCEANKVWMFAGTIPVSARDGSGKVYSALHVINDAGAIKAVYKKMHLFNVRVEDEGVEYRESDTFVAGSEPVIVATPWGNVGLAICYDLRFPELFLAMEPYQPVAFVVPSAFTLHTGKKHWHHLLSARAVDTFSWILAANQTGVHANGRSTFGHSAIVDPDGNFKAQLKEEEGFILSVIDTAACLALRKNIPLHHHRRIK